MRHERYYRSVRTSPQTRRTIVRSSGRTVPSPRHWALDGCMRSLGDPTAALDCPVFIYQSVTIIFEQNNEDDDAGTAQPCNRLSTVAENSLFDISSIRAAQSVVIINKIPPLCNFHAL